jgi:hypothetical protein
MTIIKHVLLAGISIAAVCQPAMAQEAGAKGADNQAVESDADIVVTGTRITAMVTIYRHLLR